MEATVDKLEAMFQKAEADLDYLSSKLDVEFEETKGVGDQINPCKLVQRIDDIKKDYSSLVKEAQAIKEAQEEAVGFFKDELMTMCTALQKLQTSAGINVEIPEELTDIQQRLGLPATPTSPEVTSPDVTSPAAYSSDDATYVIPAVTSRATTESVIKEEQEGAPKRKTSGKRKKEKTEKAKPSVDTGSVGRLRSGDFQPITEEEFNSVSTLIRGRVKLGDVNQAYQILWRHFVEDENTEPLTPSEMFKMNLRVSGATGEAKLKVLRALKLLHLSSKGEVKLLL